MEPLETLRTNRYWMAKRALLDIPIVDGALSPETFTQVVLYTDAQATIAALQAKLEDLMAKYQNLVAWYDKQNGTPCEQVRHRQEVEALQARVRELEEWVQDQSTANLETMRHTDEMQSRALEAEQQLTRRTAELERVRGERDEYAHKTKMLCLQNGPLMIENHDMKKLIAALPKVEGAVVVSNGYVKDSTRCHALFGADEDAALYAALLQHRQGME